MAEIINPFEWKQIKKHKQSILAIVCFVFYLAFSVPINAKISALIIQNHLHDSYTALHNWLLGVLYLLTILFLCFNYKKFTIPASVNMLIVLFSGYLFHKTIYGFNNWEIANIWLFSFFYLPIFFVFFKWYLNLDENNATINQDAIKSSFIEDNAMEQIVDDSYELKDYAQHIANKILATNPINSFGISINSEWGTGKTSFMNFIRNILENEDEIIVIEFNAWLSEKPELITKDFLDSLAEKLADYAIGIEQSIYNYSNNLLGKDKDLLKRFANEVFTFFIAENSSSTKSAYDTLRKKIEAINKKIVVLLDDTDRLESKEILEVLRLVRNTANFPNTFFILGYDRSYIEQALEESKIKNHEKYLEKIIQFEISLPSYKPEVLYNKIKKEMVDDDSDKSFIIEEDTLKKIKKDLPFWIENERDFIRFKNSYFTNIQMVKGTVNNDIFFLLELLKLKSPNGYRTMSKKYIYKTFIENDDQKYLDEIEIFELPTDEDPNIVENMEFIDEPHSSSTLYYEVKEEKEKKIKYLIIKMFYEKDESSYYKYFNYFNSKTEKEIEAYFKDFLNININALFKTISIDPYLNSNILEFYLFKFIPSNQSELDKWEEIFKRLKDFIKLNVLLNDDLADKHYNEKRERVLTRYKDENLI